jgi:hypothetical protein
MPPTMNRQDSRARGEEAFRLRAVGRTWAEISITLGYRSRGAAQLAVRRLMDRTPPETPEAARRSASEGLRITKSILFATLADASQRGDSLAVVAVAKAIGDVIDKDVRLNGFHVQAAQRVDVNVTTDAMAIIDRMESELLALVARQEPQNSIGGNIIAAEVEEITR